MKSWENKPHFEMTSSVVSLVRVVALEHCLIYALLQQTVTEKEEHTVEALLFKLEAFVSLAFASVVFLVTNVSMHPISRRFLLDS